MRLPAILAALPLLAGTASGVFFADAAPERFLLASAAASVVALIAAAGFFVLQTDEGLVLAVVIGCGAAGYASGASTARSLSATSLLAWFHAHADDASEPTTVIGVLREDAAPVSYGALLTIDVTTACAGACAMGAPPSAVSGGVRLSVGGAVSPLDVRRWRAGRTVRMPALLRTPTSFRNPGVPDEPRALARRGIALVGSVKSAALVEVTRPASVLGEAAGEVRAWTRRVLTAHLAPLSARSSAIAIAILIGDRTGLPEEDERRLQDAGTYHVIAISGGNIAIFTALLLVAGRLLRVPLRATSLIAIVGLLFYAEIAGGAASVSRATTASIVFLAALALDHRGAPLNTIAVAAIFGVALAPVAIVDPGFLLSFGATAAILAGVPRLLRGLRRDRSVAALPAATLCAEVALAPLAASFFSRVTAAGLIVNFAAIPLMTVVQAGSMALLAVSLISPGWADLAAAPVHWSAHGLVESARFVDVAPWLARDASPPAWWVCVAYYAACLGALHARLRRFSLTALAVAMLVLVAGAPLTARDTVPPAAAGWLRVVVLDVGQGDATVVTFPDRTSMVIDAGGLAGTTFDIARRVVVPSVRALGVRSLHAVVVTHADPDHISGAEGVLRAFSPAALWEGIPVPPHPTLRALAARAAEQRMLWRNVRAGDRDRAGEVEVRVLHPTEPDWERQRVRNDDSIVLELRYRDVSILLPGDIGREVERALIPTLDLGRTVVLKAAHHGSATSSSDEFLDATKPKAVIFSAGRNNRFGHPAKVVVDRMGARGIEMFSTAEDGAVFVETDGREVRVWGWASGRVYPRYSHWPRGRSAQHEEHEASKTTK